MDIRRIDKRDEDENWEVEGLDKSFLGSPTRNLLNWV